MRIGQACLGETSCPMRTVHCRSLECGPVNIALTAQPWFSCRVPSNTFHISLELHSVRKKWSQNDATCWVVLWSATKLHLRRYFRATWGAGHFSLDKIFSQNGSHVGSLFFPQLFWKVYQCFHRKAVYHKRSQLHWDKLLKFPLSSLRDTLSVLL